jgi:acyl-coenzyme A synthetase/AMP-(fatty) acid ligase
MHKSLVELLDVDDDKSRPVYQINGYWYTINDVINNSKKFAGALKKSHVNAKTKTLIVADDSIEWIFTFWALHRLGAEIFVLTNKVSAEHLIQYQKKYKIEKIITDKHDVLLSNKDDVIDINNIQCNLVEENYCKYYEHDVVINFATSGTSGSELFKFVPHTLKNFFNVKESIKNFFSLVQIDHTSTVLCSAKFNFVWGFGVQILAPVVFKTKNLIITSIISYKNLQDICNNNQVTNLILNPYLLKMLNRNATELSLRSIVVGGESLPRSTIESYFKKFCHVPLINCYGLTETLFTIIAGAVELDNPRSIGRALPNVLLKVVDNNCCEVGVNCLGRLAIKTLHQSDCYVDNSSAESFDKGWFYTSDVVKIDPDNNVIFMGRLNSCVKFKGHWHSLLTVEDAILNIDGIDDCVVIQTVSADQSISITAHVVKSNTDITDKNVIDSLKISGLRSFLIPDTIVFVENINRTANLKKIRKV